MEYINFKEQERSLTTNILWWGKHETSHEFMLWVDGSMFTWNDKIFIG